MEHYQIDRPALYVVATPIGNLDDMTMRAVSVLRHVDLVAAEDTRVTGQLLRHIGSGVKTISLREHNEREAAQYVISKLAEGLAVAQVSDAGTPAVSDPGARLVEAVHAAGYRVIPVPGPSAVLTALAAGGMSSPRFYFHGFPEAKRTARRKEFETLSRLPHTVAFFEAPHRILESIEDMAEVFGGDRLAVIGRELTKTFETIRRAPLNDLVDWVKQDSNQQRGELVVLIEAAPEKEDGIDAHDTLLKPLLDALPLKQAVRLVADMTGGNRNALYERALQLREDPENQA